MCTWCGCESKVGQGFGGRKMPDDTARHERVESQVEQLMEYGRVVNKSASKS